MIHIRLFHHIEELTRIGAEALDVAALPFGIDRIKGKRRLPRTRQPCDHHKFVTWDIHVDILEVMFARAAHFDVLQLSH